MIFTLCTIDNSASFISLLNALNRKSNDYRRLAGVVGEQKIMDNVGYI